jgi:hypothetical protein
VFLLQTVRILRTDSICFKVMAAERGATINADVEVKGLSADGFQQSYSRGRVLKTFRDNGVYVERCIVEQHDVSPFPFKQENTNRCHCTVLVQCRMLAVQTI